MEFRNFIEFNSFLRVNNMVNIHHLFTVLNDKVTSIEVTGNCCGGKEKKDKLSVEANEIYQNICGSVIPRYKPHFFQKTNDNSISFFKDGIIYLLTISR